MLKKIGYFWYDDDEIVGVCPVCGGNMYDAPYFLEGIDMTIQEREEATIGLWGVGVCPVCMDTRIWRNPGRVIGEEILTPVK